METQNDIFFYSHKNKQYGYMSNFYLCNFTDDASVSYTSSEQYFMYQKCLLFNPTNTDLLQQILNTSDPFEIKKFVCCCISICKSF